MALERGEVVALVAIRGLGIGASLITGVLGSRLIVEAVGLEGFGTISLVLALPALLVFADAGMGSVVVNSTSDLRTGRESGRSLLAAAVHISAVACVVLILAATVAGTFDLWPRLLGATLSSIDGAGFGASLTIAIVGLTSVFGLSARVIQGARHNVRLALWQVLTPILYLITVWMLLQVRTPVGWVGSANAVASLSVALLMTVAALRLLGRGVVKDLVRPMPRSEYGAAWRLGRASMLVSLAVALTFQASRVVLGHRGTAAELAQFALWSPMGIAGLSIVNQVAQTLWPAYRERVHEGSLTWREMRRDLAQLVVLALCVGIGLILFGPLVIGFIAGDSGNEGVGLGYAYTALMVVQAIQLPGSMLLTDARGFVHQSILASAAGVVAVAGGWIAAPAFGAIGVVVAPALAILFVQLPATLWLVNRKVVRA